MAVGIAYQDDRRLIVSGSMVASVLLHLVVGLIVLGIRWPVGSDAGHGSMAEEPMVVPQEREDELALGVDEARAASINWLGIKKPESVEGDAELSEVDQAAQTLVVGDSIEAALAAPEESVEVVVDPVEEVVEPVDSVATQEVAESEPQEMLEAAQELVVDVVDAVPESLTDTVREAVEGVDAVLQESISVVVIPEESEGAQSEDAQTLEEQVERVAQDQVEVEPKVVQQVVQQVVQRSENRVVGTQGVLSDREVAATRIKKAIKVDPHKPNEPIIGKGLEILTVRPRYTSAVRLSGIPKNPVVLMWFDSTGKVSRAEFVRDGRVVYSSGTVGVDEPLLNAIYQWRAKGKQIDDLDPKDPADLVEVTIKIVFRRERSGSTD